jgi:hypothetical protein
VITDVRRKKADILEGLKNLVEGLMVKMCVQLQWTRCEENGEYQTRGVNEDVGTRPRTERQMETRRNEQARETKETI